MRISDWSSDVCSSDLKYNGSDDRRTLPAFYFRGRVSGYSFSTRGTNFQIDLIRQRRGQKTDFKFGPTISLRGDRTGKIDDPQVAALGKRKVAVEMGRSEEHTSELQSLMRISYAVVCLKKQKHN